MSVYVIAGLGNPGPQYQWTRHNAGFLFLDRLANQEGIPVTKKTFSSLTGEWNYGDHRLVLIKPQTFMNLSGRAVMQTLQFHKLPLTHLIVVHDDLDIPFGSVRLKQDGGHGGHNGLRSIMELLGRGDFIRLRIGIGRPLHGDASGYVLGNIPPDQMEQMPHILDGGRDILEMLFKDGLPKAMSLNNNRNFLEG